MTASENATQALVNALLRRCRSLDLSVAEQPAGLLHQRFPSQELLSHEPRDDEGRDDDDWHFRVVDEPSFIIDGTWGVRVVRANEPDVSRALAAIHLQAAIDQVHNPGLRYDLHTWVACPRASAGKEDWILFRHRLESDDRVCRKLVWLPSDVSADGAASFLRRTFLARPWVGDSRAPPIELDPVRRMVESADQDLAGVDVAGWVELAASSKSDDEVAAALLRTAD